MDVLELWAKSEPYHPLWCHLLDVAAVCGALLRRFGPVKGLSDQWMMYLAAIHDIGKADVEFQNKSAEQADRLRALGIELPEKVTRFRHEARSAEWIVPRMYGYGWDKHVCRTASTAIRGHHGDFRAGLSGNDDLFYNENQPAYRERTALWNRFRDDLDRLVREALELPEGHVPEFENQSVAGIQIVGLIVLADWIASNPQVFRYEDIDRTATSASYFSAASQVAEDVVHSLQFDRTGPSSEEYVVPQFQEVWPAISEPRPFQKRLEEACRSGLKPGLAILEAPMGEGKTEGAIYVALHWNRLLGREGLYIALPTMATSNQMHSRYKAFLESRQGSLAPRLIHGMSWLVEEDQPEEKFEVHGDVSEPVRARDWFANAKRALLAPEGVGTVDQVLMAALNVKHGFLRFLGLSARTLIIDEVHAYDVYMTALMCKLLSWCRALHIPVILLSATLSRRQKRELIEAYGGADPCETPDAAQDPYPLLTFIPWDSPAQCTEAAATHSRSITIEKHYGLLPDGSRGSQERAYSATTDLAVNLSQNGGCICVLMNTVAAAQAVYRLLPVEIPKLLFHARFTAHRRNEIEKQVLRYFGKGPVGEPENPERPKQFILVCTQVVEQSLDVDFDAMITQLAPIDLLLQRIGRIWRHERGSRPTGPVPVLHVLLPESGTFATKASSASTFGATGKVYEHHEVLLRSLAQLETRNAFHLPDDFRPLVEACYGAEAVPAGISADIYTVALEASRKKDIEDRAQAQVHLIPDPHPQEFRLGLLRQNDVEEGSEGEAANYFRARTRLGDETRNVLLVEDPLLQQAIRRGMLARQEGKRNHAFPGNRMLRQLFLQKASVPAWWLNGLMATDGFEIVSTREGPDWLRSHTALFMRNQEWHGTQNNQPVILREHNEEGLLFEALKATGHSDRQKEPMSYTEEEEEEDADVGSAS